MNIFSQILSGFQTVVSFIRERFTSDSSDAYDLDAREQEQHWLEDIENAEEELIEAEEEFEDRIFDPEIEFDAEDVLEAPEVIDEEIERFLDDEDDDLHAPVETPSPDDDTPNVEFVEWFEDDTIKVPPYQGDMDEWLDDVQDAFDLWDDDNRDLVDQIFQSLVSSADVEDDPDLISGSVFHGEFDSLEDVGKFLAKSGGAFEWTIQELKQNELDALQNEMLERYAVYIDYDS